MRGIIIEGLSTTGKTSVFAAIKKLHSQNQGVEQSVVALSEHYSQVLHSYQGVLRSMGKDEHLQLLKRHVDYLEQQDEWIGSLGHLKRSNDIFYLLERFHLNHRGAFTGSEEIGVLEKRLSKMNARCILLTISPDAVEPRFIESRGEAWKSYVMEDHGGVAEICEKFLGEQERLRRCASDSLIPTLEINTDEGKWDSYAEEILDMTFVNH
ncbi:hypothetical protein [Cohnella sp. GCM10012308]|uniref:hypothetical protein n=1 Tax=Cohnella sp. GCM10012308 TaxID=3317329 RepID=UPI0036239410